MCASVFVIISGSTCAFNTTGDIYAIYPFAGCGLLSVSRDPVHKSAL